jgi:carbonic anhydrase/acetyltransferase-like protein (isoleucine patch superfamily)
MTASTPPDAASFPHPTAPIRPSGYVDEIDIAADAFVAPNAVLVGAVTVGARSSVWYNCVLRGDISDIVIGADSNLQDGTVVHGSLDLTTSVGDRVTVGHQCLIHACTVGSRAVVGMASTILDGAVVGEGALVAAGSVVREGTQIPAGTFWAGVPATQKGDVSQAWEERFDQNWRQYVNNAWAYRRKLAGPSSST